MKLRFVSCLEPLLKANTASSSRLARLLKGPPVRAEPFKLQYDGEQLFDLIVKHYADLSPRYRTLIPLRQIYVPDITD